MSALSENNYYLSIVLVDYKKGLADINSVN